MNRQAHSIQIRKSPIAGLGMFACEPIPRGDRIRRIHVEREITAEAPLREDRGERPDHCDYPDGKVLLLGYPDRHVNHSCDPNCFVLYDADVSYLVARRDIEQDEEITCDYNINISGGTAWPCHCGAARCRGTVEGDFFKLPPERQREYRPLLAEWFVRRHADRLPRMPSAHEHA